MTKINLLKLTCPLSSFAVVIATWESMVRFGLIKSIFLPAPSEIFLAFLKNYEYLFTSVLITLKHVFIGYFIGILLAIFLGILIGWYRKLELSINSLLLIISPIPIVTFLPLFIVWFGLGVAPIILCTIMGAFFPTLMSTISGVKKVNPGYIEVVKNFSQKKVKILRKVILPASLPYITNGLRTSMQMAFLITPVAEMLMGDVGMGGLIWQSADLFKTELVILGQITLGIFGLGLFKLFDLVERNLILPWMQIKK